jgi:hypothetical protein
MVPTFVKQARRGKMKYIIGDGRNVWDFTYVGNVAQAHVLVGGGSDPDLRGGVKGVGGRVAGSGLTGGLLAVFGMRPLSSHPNSALVNIYPAAAAASTGRRPAVPRLPARG